MPAAGAAGNDAPGKSVPASGAPRSASPAGGGLFTRAAPWAGATALVVLAVAVLYFFTGAAATEAFEAPPVAADDLSYGPENPELTVIEYSDFQCPFCAEYAKWMTQLRAKYGDRVKFVFRNYPLADHEWAQFAAQVAYAASLQGKFWEMHDLLFERQDEWASSSDPRPFSTPTPRASASTWTSSTPTPTHRPRSTSSSSRPPRARRPA